MIYGNFIKCIWIQTHDNTSQDILHFKLLDLNTCSRHAILQPKAEQFELNWTLFMRTRVNKVKSEYVDLHVTCLKE